jgi:hypothetical protein
MWIEPSTVRDGIAARAVERHADETSVVRVARVRLQASGIDIFDYGRRAQGTRRQPARIDR